MLCLPQAERIRTTGNSLYTKMLYEHAQKNDVDSIALQLKMLSAEQFEIASEVMTNLLKAFSLKK